MSSVNGFCVGLPARRAVSYRARPLQLNPLAPLQCQRILSLRPSLRVSGTLDRNSLVAQNRSSQRSYARSFRPSPFIGCVAVRNIAAWDGSTWRALGNGIAGYAGALLVHNGQLYAGGSADNGSSGSAMLQRFTSSGWEELSTVFPTNNGAIYSLVSDGTNIFAGGSFTAPGSNVARFDGTTWHPLGAGLDGTINALALWNGELYAAGTFTGSMAKWTGTEWLNLGATFRPRAPTRLQSWNDGLYIAGDFTNINNITIRDLARYNGDTFAALTDENIAANIYGVSADAEKIYFTGDIAYVDGNPEPGALTLAQGVGTWSGSSFDNLYHPDFSNGVGFFVNAIGEHAGDIYAGGTFRGAGDASANYIARWDGDKWNNLSTGLENLMNSDTPRVDALLSHAGDLFVGGSFSHAGGVLSRNVAIWTGTEWRAAGEGLNGRVRRLVVYQGSVIATGAFTASGAQTILFVARWNGSAWENLEAFGLGSLIGSQGAHEAIVANDTLYVGGILLADGGSYSNSVFRLVGDSYEFLGGFNRLLSSMAVYNNELYVSGQFTRVNRTLTITNIAKWDGASWSAVASTMNDQVNGLAVHKGRLHVTGRFDQSTTVSNLNGIARLGDSDWEPLGAGLWASPPAGANGAELFSNGDDFWIGGIFSKAGAVDSLNFARWNDQIDFYATSATEITVTTVTLIGDQLTLSISATSPVPIIIEATTDFASWSEVTSGTGSFQETVSTVGTARYFRARTAD